MDEAERSGAIRRAQLLLAAGGDPRRQLDPGDRAVRAVAEDLDAETARAQLRAGLEGLGRDSGDLPRVSAARTRLLDDPELAWRLYACALLADAMSD